MAQNLRNIAIIAHVDHGKTTLIDQLLRQSGTLAERGEQTERVMDSNDLERERGITILSKNCAITWTSPSGEVFKINIVDTPGHADFGGEVERVLSMVDCVLLLVDAVDGPMPQTRFVTQKAFAMGLNPIVVINKVDRDGARPTWVLDQTFDLFDNLGANDKQLDFPVIYASALNGYAGNEDTVRSGDMTPLFELITKQVPPPPAEVEGPFQMQISTLSYSSYVGVIGIGRIRRGSIRPSQTVTVIDREGQTRSGRVLQVFGFVGSERVEIAEGNAGDIVSLAGIDKLNISDTLCDPADVVALPPLTVDEPTMNMTFAVNKSPFAGKSGKYLTSRQILDRLQTELKHNVALRVENTEDPDRFRVSGRGQLHLSVLIETMRREGFELAVSRPVVLEKDVDGERHEPYELAVIDVETEHQGAVINVLNERRGELQDMIPDGRGRVRLEYMMPTRGLIGLHTLFMSLTSGTGILTHIFDHFGPKQSGSVAQRPKGVMIANSQGKSLAYALFNLQERGKLFIGHGDEVYEGMVIGEHARDNDLVVNSLKAKQLNNIRAAGTDENLVLVTPIRMTLEQALEFINDDELVEVTPDAIRIRKMHLLEHERKRAGRAA